MERLTKPVLTEHIGRQTICLVPRMVRWTPAYQSYYSVGDEAECYCPVCDSDVVEDDDYFCPTCGQALKYHDEPEN